MLPGSLNSAAIFLLRKRTKSVSISRYFTISSFIRNLLSPTETKVERLMRAKIAFKEAVKELQVPGYSLPEEELKMLNRDPNALTIDQIEALATYESMNGNSNEAMRLWEAGAKRGSEECHLRSAAAMRISDPSKAFQSFKRLADEKKNVVAQYTVGVMYNDGVGVEQNLALAFSYFHASANAGYIPAWTNLGNCYVEGRGTDRDFEKAANAYKWAVELGRDRIAMFNLGLLVTSGKVHDKDVSLKRGYDLIRQAAKLGHPVAAFNMGVACFEGNAFVQQDYREAVSWYQLSATGGFSRALANLGLMYYSGTGVKKDLQKAKVIFLKGASLGEEVCRGMLPQVESRELNNLEK